ncbi:alpha/beta fold hydrolase [Thalassotalea ponticola]|uniref:alpha/beta fold hydrolase n=1 Tax=Thalassotalea ponticola TaxID=1523392 RepID=UPI0025B58948|nr:alpha/beta fold hydrolase [Thalassotalea ponticola]MDN3652984.1 alpha/beta fold hydrolase [Thalassotalea ponticola]
MTKTQDASPSYTFSQEADLLERQASIEHLWQQGTIDAFKSKDGLDIYYALFIIEPQRPCIVVSPGRSESLLKYKEVTVDLINNGYNVALIDHRGQGLSTRQLKDKYKGYVANFQDYVDDFEQFVSTIVKVQCPQSPCYLLAHSMGATIAMLHLQQYPQTFVAASLSAPMIEINTQPIPAWLAKTLVKLWHGVSRLFTDQSPYFISHGPFKPKVFDGNDLMQSKVRFDIFQNLYRSTPNIQLGGVTLAWLNAAIDAQVAILSGVAQIATPTLVLQAGSERVVSNAQQGHFCRLLHRHNPRLCADHNPCVIANARHELLFEIDPIRHRALSATLDWFAHHP